MSKKLGPLFWGSQELKLFDWVYVPGAGISYAPCPNQFLPYLRTGFGWWWSPPSRIRDGGPVPINKYVLVRDCWSSQKPSPFWGNLSPVTLIDLCKFDWVPKTLLFLFSIKNLTVSFWVIWFWACQASSYACPSSVEFVVYSCGAIHSSILRILLSVPQIWGFCCKYYDKMLENRAPEQWNFYCFSPKWLIFNWLGPQFSSRETM